MLQTEAHPIGAAWQLLWRMRLSREERGSTARRSLWIVMALSVIGLEARFVRSWLSGDGAVRVTRREPESPHADPPSTGRQSDPLSSHTLAKGKGIPSSLQGSWPQFRGPNRTGWIEGLRSLPENLPTKPRVRWSLEVGEGHAGVAVLDGRVFLHDYDATNQREAIRCFSLDDAAEIWRFSYPLRIKRNHGMSRTVPAVTRHRLVALGPKCHVTCLDSRSGEQIWQLDLVKEYRTVVPPWYAGQCPLIEDDVAIIAPGGDCLMMAIDLNEKRVRWQVPNPDGWTMTHSSIMIMETAGLKQCVLAGSGGVVGVSVQDGTLLWKHTPWSIRIATVPSPVILPEGKILLTGGYGAGSVLLQVTRHDGQFQVAELWRQEAGAFSSTQQTPIAFGDLIFTTLPLGTPDAGQIAAIHHDGSRAWTSGRQQRFGLGPYAIVDGRLFALNDQSGELDIFDLRQTPPAHDRTWKVLDGHDAWAPMAAAGTQLIIRDSTRMICLDLDSEETS